MAIPELDTIPRHRRSRLSHRSDKTLGLEETAVCISRTSKPTAALQVAQLRGHTCVVRHAGEGCGEAGERLAGLWLCCTCSDLVSPPLAPRTPSAPPPGALLVGSVAAPLQEPPAYPERPATLPWVPFASPLSPKQNQALPTPRPFARLCRVHVPLPTDYTPWPAARHTGRFSCRSGHLLCPPPKLSSLTSLPAWLSCFFGLRANISPLKAFADLAKGHARSVSLHMHQVYLLLPL